MRNHETAVARIRLIGRFLIALVALYWALSPLWLLVGGLGFNVVLAFFVLHSALAVGLAVVFVKRGYSVEHAVVFDAVMFLGLLPFNYLRTSTLWPFRGHWIPDRLVTAFALATIYCLAYLLVCGNTNAYAKLEAAR